jgi:hypothetical protein
MMLPEYIIAMIGGQILFSLIPICPPKNKRPEIWRRAGIADMQIDSGMLVISLDWVAVKRGSGYWMDESYPSEIQIPVPEYWESSRKYPVFIKHHDGGSMENEVYCFIPVGHREEYDVSDIKVPSAAVER